MLSFTTPLYQHSPIWLQEIYIATRSFGRNMLRERGRFQSELEELQQTQWLSEDELVGYQLERMLVLVQYAAKHVPYYAVLFDKENIKLGDFGDLESFKKIPILNKQAVVQAGKALLSKNFRSVRFKGATSGTTGLSMIGFRDLRAINRENAFIWRQLQWAGLQKGQKRAWIRGDMIAPVSQLDPPFWRVNHTDNMLMMSSFHLSERSAEAYIQALQEFDPVVIQAYPSSIAFLARYLDSRGKSYEGTQLKGVVTSSETLLADQRKVIEHALGCRVFDWYGCFERVAAIGTCEHGNYHILSDYGLTELIPQEDGSAEIVATGFHNFLMPLLRYRAGDAVVPAKPDFCCPCGRAFPVVKEILGRMDDSVKTPDGRNIGMMVNMFDGMENIWEGQVVQDRLDEIRVLVVPMRELSDGDKAYIVSKARLLVGPEMKIRVEVVQEIPRTKNGKLRAVVCNI